MVKKHKSYNYKHKEKMPVILIAVVSVVVVLLLAGAFFLFTSEEKLDYSQYNSFQFTKLSEGWQTLVEMDDQLYEVPFYNHPHDIAGIEYNDNVTSHIKDLINTVTPKREIIIAIHPDSGSVPVLAGVNIARITGKFYGAQTSSALYLEDDEAAAYNNAELPVVNCGDSNLYTTIIKIALNESKNSVDFMGSNHCILVGADTADNLLMASDLIGYKLLGIMR